MFLKLASGLLAIALACSAAVKTVHVVERTDVDSGKSFGQAGPYERIRAKAWFTIDPALPQNRIIADIDLAPKNAAGQVEFTSDVYVLKPRDPAKSNGTVFFSVSNRGGLSVGPLGIGGNGEVNDAFLLDRGFTIVMVGWQWDVDPAKAEMLHLYAPRATGTTGPVRAEFTPLKATTQMPLGDRGTHVPYEPATTGGALTVREKPDAKRVTIPASQYSVANGSITMSSGFKPGKIYEFVYTGKDSAIAGLGPAAIRDFISFLKYGGGDNVALLKDVSRWMKRSVGFGISQSGRFLRKFVYDGFNEDEKGRIVFDGVWAHVAGAGRGSFNNRFAQPSRDGHRLMNNFYPTDIFPFTDLEETDAETGAKGGILARATAKNVVPKIFYTNGSYEYWGRAASLIHTTADGKQDAPLAPSTRVYYLTGTQHGSGRVATATANTQQQHNINDYSFLMRGLAVAMNDWVTSGKEPPASSYPLIAKDQLVSKQALAFPKIPGIALPYSPHLAYRADYGPEFATAGIIANEPPKVGKPFPVLLPQVNTDGNETSGLIAPEVAVPLGTYTGWNLRAPAIGSPDEQYDMVGSFIAFPRTKAERAAKKDPRPSIEERYTSKDDYLAKVRAAADALVAKGYLLSDDVTKIVARSAAEWDWLATMK